MASRSGSEAPVHRPLHHAWNVSPREAAAIQDRLRDRVVVQDRVGTVRHVIGVDVGFEQSGDITRAAVVALSFPQLKRVEFRVARQATRFPYVPGLLSFRELPAVLEALTALAVTPDLVLCDAHGLAHPRRFGLACHLGVALDTPVIGVAKSRLVGGHDPVPPARGSWVPLYDAGEIIGAALRTRAGVRPVYVSVGHRICLETAIRYVMASRPRYRLPETTRQAHRLASGGGAVA